MSIFGGAGVYKTKLEAFRAHFRFRTNFKILKTRAEVNLNFLQLMSCVINHLLPMCS